MTFSLNSVKQMCGAVWYRRLQLRGDYGKQHMNQGEEWVVGIQKSHKIQDVFSERKIDFKLDVIYEHPLFLVHRPRSFLNSNGSRATWYTTTINLSSSFSLILFPVLFLRKLIQRFVLSCFVMRERRQQIIWINLVKRLKMLVTCLLA